MVYMQITVDVRFIYLIIELPGTGRPKINGKIYWILSRLILMFIMEVTLKNYQFPKIYNLVSTTLLGVLPASIFQILQGLR